MITTGIELCRVVSQIGNTYGTCKHFFFNLYTSFGGGRISGTSCVNPPTIHEYLFSCNNNLLINPPHDLVEEVVAIKNGYYIDE
jgi:hypothetical protein